jgi:hypothetical protein
MSIERIKQDAAKADQLIRDLAKSDVAVAEEESEEEAAQPEVEEQQTDQGVVADAATEDQSSANPDLDRILQESAKWEQRYRSLDGMIQARDRQIEQLTHLLANMQQAPAHTAEQPKQSSKLISKEDEDAFGADLIDLARRVAKEESGSYISQLENKLAQLTEQLQGVAQTTAVTVHDRFENQLTQAVPNWRQIDADQKFIEWLQANPTRNKVFAEAAKAQDVQGVAYFFEEYAGKAPQGAAKPTVDPRLEKQVAPGRSKSVPTAAKSQPDKKQWTRTEIAGFYANGRKQYSTEEYAKLERDLFNAQKEGRVDFTR